MAEKSGQAVLVSALVALLELTEYHKSAHTHAGTNIHTLPGNSLDNEVF